MPDASVASTCLREVKDWRVWKSFISEALLQRLLRDGFGGNGLQLFFLLSIWQAEWSGEVERGISDSNINCGLVLGLRCQSGRWDGRWGADRRSRQFEALSLFVTQHVVSDRVPHFLTSCLNLSLSTSPRTWSIWQFSLFSSSHYSGFLIASALFWSLITGLTTLPRRVWLKSVIGQ